jgi:TPR repeat protein
MNTNFRFLLMLLIVFCGLNPLLSHGEEDIDGYLKKAKQGDVEAQFMLGFSYANGIGVEKNEAEAVKWYRIAADKGDEGGQFYLGECYANGMGVEKNEAEAVKWYRKAADKGIPGAQLNLGVMYKNGDGVVKNIIEAYKWSLLAAANGIEPAKINVETIESTLTPEQRVEGQRLATEWQAEFEKKYHIELPDKITF